MAVHTAVAPHELSIFLARYAVGALVAFEGIAQGIENSNYRVETSGGRFILTLYEGRVDPADLPFFVALLTHLRERGAPVPGFIADREGTVVQQLAGRAACLIEHLPGVPVERPQPHSAARAAAALAACHRAAADFPLTRANPLGPEGWVRLADEIGPAGLDSIAPGLGERVSRELDHVAAWPRDLPRAVIHSDLFPDNVLIRDGRVTGLIDFYFAASEIVAYDAAVMHASWCFSDDGRSFSPAISAALLGGFGASLSPREREALPLLARGAALRFLLTRAADWLRPSAGPLVTRKDPLAFLRRLDFYADPANQRLVRGQADGA